MGSEIKPRRFFWDRMCGLFITQLFSHHSLARREERKDPLEGLTRDWWCTRKYVDGVYKQIIMSTETLIMNDRLVTPPQTGTLSWCQVDPGWPWGYQKDMRQNSYAHSTQQHTETNTWVKRLVAIAELFLWYIPLTMGFIANVSHHQQSPVDLTVNGRKSLLPAFPCLWLSETVLMRKR